MRADPSQTIPTRSSESQEWIQWHKDLLKYFRKKNLANSIWVYAWGKRGGVGAKGNNSTLRNYMRGYGIDIDKTTVQSLGDTVDGIFDSFSSAFSGVGMGILILGGIVILVVIRIIWKLGDDPNKSLKVFTTEFGASKVIK